jgi:hypothetical protein
MLVNGSCRTTLSLFAYFAWFAVSTAGFWLKRAAYQKIKTLPCDRSTELQTQITPQRRDGRRDLVGLITPQRRDGSQRMPNSTAFLGR